MKKPEWKEIIQGHLKIATFGEPYRPGRIRRAIYKNVTVSLKITKEEKDAWFSAIVIGFEPPESTLPDLKIGDEVLVGVQHFLPD